MRYDTLLLLRCLRHAVPATPLDARAYARRLRRRYCHYAIIDRQVWLALLRRCQDAMGSRGRAPIALCCHMFCVPLQDIDYYYMPPY